MATKRTPRTAGARAAGTARVAGTARAAGAGRGATSRASGSKGARTTRGGTTANASARTAKRPGPFEELDDVAPGLMRSQNAWLSQIDSLAAPDRKTHELIRMVCSVVARNPQGIRRHAMLAAEVGASWEEVAGSVILAEPAFGILVAVEAFPWARKGWERGASLADGGRSSGRG